MQTFFQRPDRLDAPLDVIVAVFNSARYRTRWKHYEDFVTMAERAGPAVRLWTVEVAFGARAFVVTEAGNPRHLQLRTSTEIWHKERSQNLMLARVVTQFPDARYIAFIDADVTFIRHDWADEARHALQHYDVIQMWQEAHDLDHAGRVLQSHRSFCDCYAAGIPLPGSAGCYYYPRGKQIHFHPGFAWAWRRRALDDVGGLIDWAILGSADFHMAWALIGKVQATIERVKHGRRYAEAMKEWELRGLASIKRNVGAMSGAIFHHFHGPKVSRQYESRYKILEQTKFDPFLDLVRDAQGLYKLQHHGNKRSDNLRDMTRRYFHSRDEDASR